MIRLYKSQGGGRACFRPCLPLKGREGGAGPSATCPALLGEEDSGAGECLAAGAAPPAPGVCCQRAACVSPPWHVTRARTFPQRHARRARPHVRAGAARRRAVCVSPVHSRYALAGSRPARPAAAHPNAELPPSMGRACAPRRAPHGSARHALVGRRMATARRRLPPAHLFCVPRRPQQRACAAPDCCYPVLGLELTADAAGGFNPSPCLKDPPLPLLAATLGHTLHISGYTPCAAPRRRALW
ncbi:MAG: hypothetical protein J3K34DRAFT_437898, partial [Monoraphidium minutum]